jgi:MFS family permease
MTPARPMPVPAVIALACLALVLNLLAFMTTAAVLPTLIADWRLSGTGAGWLGGALFAGCAAGVMPLVGLTDRVLPKRVVLASTALMAASSAGMALFAEGLWSGIFFRLLGGIGLAGFYMPGLKALTDTLDSRWRSRAASYYSSVFSLGTALSIWSGGAVADWLGWRWSFGVAALGSVAALALYAFFLPPGRVHAGAAARALLDIRPVLRNRASTGNVLAYAGHLWEVFGFRVWGVTFLVHAGAAYGTEGLPLSPVLLATLAALIGVPAAMAIGEAAVRFDRSRVLYAVMAASVIAAPLVGLAASMPFVVLAGLMLLFGMTCYGDTGVISAGNVLFSEPETRGLTMAVYSSVGFVGGLLGPIAAGLALDLAGGPGVPGAWTVAFAVIGLGSLFGIAAVRYGSRRV